MEQWEAGPATDAEVSRRVFGRGVLGIVPCHQYQDGSGWSASMEGERSWTEMRPVVLREGGCAEAFHSPEHRLDGESLVFGHHFVCLEVVPEYSGDIAWAWLVVERMRECGYTTEIRLGANDRQVWVLFIGWDWKHPNASALASTLPEAICRAALAATPAPQG